MIKKIFQESIPRVGDCQEYKDLVRVLERNQWVEFIKRLLKGASE